MNGIGWLTTAKALSLPTLALAGVLYALALFIRTLPQLRRVQMEGDNSLREALLARVAKLEARTEELERLLGQEQVRHAAEQAKSAAEIADLRHDLANETASLDAFLLLAESNPDKVIEQIPTIREMRRQHRERVALKRGMREGAVIASASASPE